MRARLETDAQRPLRNRIDPKARIRIWIQGITGMNSFLCKSPHISRSAPADRPADSTEINSPASTRPFGANFGLDVITAGVLALPQCNVGRGGFSREVILVTISLQPSLAEVVHGDRGAIPGRLGLLRAWGGRSSPTFVRNRHKRYEPEQQCRVEPGAAPASGSVDVAALGGDSGLIGCRQRRQRSR